MSAESDSSSSADPEPTRALLLAQALETCIQAERRVPGSADHVIARQPAWARAELRRLVALAGSLDAVATSAIMSEDFRVAARARLMRHIAPGSAGAHPRAAGQHGRTPSDGPRLTSVPPTQAPRGHAVSRWRRRRSNWLWRGGLGGLFAAVLLTAATLTASAHALPGDPLYSLKQVREEFGVRFAPDDESRALALLGRADARLDETTQLLQQGRTDQVAQTTLQYDDAISRATTTYVVTIADFTSGDTNSNAMESRLSQQQQQIQTLLTSAPEPARADLREALVATERSKALVAEPKPADRRDESASRVAAAPTTPPEPQDAPTRPPERIQVASVPPPVDLVAQATSTPLPVAHEPERHEGRSVGTRNAEAGHERDDEGTPPSTVTTVVAVSRAVVNARQSSGPAPSKHQDQRLDDVKLAPAPAVTMQDAVDTETPADVSRDRNGSVVVVPTSGHGGDDGRVVSPPLHDDTGAHDRVAQLPAPTPQVVVAQQHSNASGGSGDGDSGKSSTPPTAQPATLLAQTGTARAVNRDTGASGSDAPRASASASPSPTPQVARNQSSGSDDHHTSSDSGSSRSSTTSTRSTSGSGGSSGSGSHTGSGSSSGGDGGH